MSGYRQVFDDLYRLYRSNASGLGTFFVCQDLDCKVGRTRTRTCSGPHFLQLTYFTSYLCWLIGVIDSAHVSMQTQPFAFFLPLARGAQPAKADGKKESAYNPVPAGISWASHTQQNESPRGRGLQDGLTTCFSCLARYMYIFIIYVF